MAVLIQGIARQQSRARGQPAPGPPEKVLALSRNHAGGDARQHRQATKRNLTPTQQNAHPTPQRAPTPSQQGPVCSW